MKYLPIEQTEIFQTLTQVYFAFMKKVVELLTKGAK